MRKYSRRDSLLFLIGIPIIGTGCLSRSEEPLQLCQIDVYSRTYVPHEVELQLLNDSEIVHEAVYELESSEEYIDGVEIDDSNIPSDRGHFTIKAKVAGREWNKWYLPDYSDDSILAILRTNGDPPEIEFSYSTDINC